MADGPDCTCGGKIAASRRDGFCSSWCATRDAQGLEPQAPPSRFPSPPTVLVPGTVPGTVPGDDVDEPRRPRYRQRRRLIADEVEDKLRAAGMLDTWQAATVLDLADSLDWTGGSGSARASLHRELERQMRELLRGVDAPGSAVGAMRDELEARRRQRAGGAS